MTKDKINNYLIAAGGTGGHVFPALAIADEIKKLDANSNFLFVGTKNKIEAKLVPQHGYQFKTIWISGLSRKFDMKILLFPIKLIVSFLQAFITIKKFKPTVVIGTGGYVCAPVLLIASLLNIKTAIHESNSYPGLVTRLLSSKVDKVFTSFDVTKKWLKDASRVEKVGNPTRNFLINVSKDSGLEFFRLDKNKKTLLIFGGSLGAESINSAIQQHLNNFINSNIQLIWQTGEKDFQRIKNYITNLDPKIKNCIWYDKFIDRMEYAYAAADLVICRAGATTIAEITLLGKPAILVPYPYATADHQTINAQTLQESGAAIMINDNDLPNKIEDIVFDLMKDDNRLNQMKENSLKLSNPDAGKNIAQKILNLIS